MISHHTAKLGSKRSVILQLYYSLFSVIYQHKQTENAGETLMVCNPIRVA